MRGKHWQRTAGIFAMVLCAALVIGVVIIASPSTLPELDADALLNFEQTTILYDRNGNEIANLYAGENRRLTALDSVPDHVINAFLACEDSRFYKHRGVDIVRLIGAAIANIKSGDYSQGASTITQQLIKLTYLTPDKTLTRKIHEAILALDLETKLSKNEILTLYLNRAYFGGGAYGISSAAKFYFNLDIERVSIAQGALLAAIVKSPTRYAPHIQPENALVRRNLVLDMMLNKAYITQDQHDNAIEEPFGVIKNAVKDVYSWYIDSALSEAEDILHLSADDIFGAGLKIYTALDPALQSKAENLFTDPARFPANADDGTLAQAALVGVMVDTGEILCVVGGREYSVKRGLNRATQAYRQPGSALKPLAVYAPAIERFNYMPISILDDSPEDFSGYAPSNPGGSYSGAVTLREAVVRSLNLPAVKLLNDIGISTGFNAVERAGIPLDQRDNVLPLALGAITKGVTPLSLANAYTQFASGGEINKAHTIDKIVNNRGITVYEHTASPQRILPAETAYIMTDLLKSVAESGTARALNGVAPTVAAKTGSVAMQNGGNRDAWVVAFTPSLSLCVWMGFDQPDETHKLPEGTNGGNKPSQLAAQFLRDIPVKWRTGQYSRPNTLIEAVIDKKALMSNGTPLLAGENTPKDQTLLEIFHANDRPTEVSDLFALPLPVTNLAIISGGEYPVITFTAPEDGVSYRILQETASGSREIAMLSASAKETIAWEDRTLNKNTARSYAVIPVRIATDTQGTPVVVSMASEPQGFSLWGWSTSPTDTIVPTEMPEPNIEDAPLFR